VYHNRYAETSGWIRDSVAFALKAADGSKSMVRRTLAEGLGLGDGSADGRWLAMREQRSGLEYLRSVREIRELGVHVSLRAYETRVFWELRELADAAGVWGRLAERLGGRGVPSLEGALRELELTPVHDALRTVIAEPSRPTVERLVAAVADATGTEGNQAAVVDLVATRHASIEAIVAGIDDPSQESAMRLWTLLAPLGSLPAGADAGATSRAWYEELRLAPVVADGLRDRGLDEAGAWWAAERIRMLLALAIPSQLGGPAGTLPSRLVDAWFADPSVRAYLRVNRWDGADWFHRESWTELLAWSDRLERVLTPPDARARKPVERSVLTRRLAEAAEASGYQVEGLRAALAAPAKPSPAAASTSATKPRLPKATGLPPGPGSSPGPKSSPRRRP
jgi:hypothetical protein